MSRRGGGSGCDNAFYTLLGVDPKADAADIKKAYRKLALQHHPDRGGDAEKFKALSAAYEVLADEQQRAVYDKYGEEGLKEGGGGGGHDPNDVFAQFFGGGGGMFGGGGRQQRKPTKTPDVQHPLSLTLADFYRGRTKKLKVQRQVLCGTCRGKGSEKDGAVQKCGGCRGQGVRIVMHRIGPGMVQQAQVACSDCQGTGETIKASDRCKECNGRKTKPESKILEVVVPRGKQPGSRMPFYNMADEAADLEAGDLVIVLQPSEDDEGADGKRESFSVPAGPIADPSKVKRPRFQRLKTGVDLVIEISISLVEALLGFRLAFRHLDDRIIIVENTSIVENEAILTVENEGMPLEHSPNRCGDLIIKVAVKFPTAQQVKALKPEQVAALRGVLPQPLHQIAAVDAVVGKTLKKCDDEEYEVHLVAAKPYDPEEHKDKQRQRHSEARGSRGAEDEDDDEGPRGGSQCKQM